MEHRQLGLAADSVYYYSKAGIYERFARAEDTPGLVARFLRAQLARKDVLDLGCGTGKYAALLSPCVRSYTGLDISPDALALAARRCPGCRLIRGAAQDIPLPAGSLDAVFACWVLGTMPSADARSAALAECRRVLRPHGTIYLIENDIGGEFEYVRGRCPDTRRTAAYNDELTVRGFEAAARFQTAFSFESYAEARRVFGSIWGEAAAARVAGRAVGQRVVIFSRRESSRHRA